MSQGQRVPGVGDSGVFNIRRSYEDFNAYDIGLYSTESSCNDISSSGSTLLHPVPSLPGLAEPPILLQQGGAAALPIQAARGSSTVKLVKQAGGGAPSSNSSSSPTCQASALQLQQQLLQPLVAANSSKCRSFGALPHLGTPPPLSGAQQTLAGS